MASGGSYVLHSSTHRITAPIARPHRFLRGIFFLVVTTSSAIVYERPTPSTSDLLLSGVPYYASIGFGVLLLLVSHKVDPSTGANWANFWSVFAQYSR